MGEVLLPALYVTSILVRACSRRKSRQPVLPTSFPNDASEADLNPARDWRPTLSAVALFTW